MKPAPNNLPSKNYTVKTQIHKRHPAISFLADHNQMPAYKPMDKLTSVRDLKELMTFPLLQADSTQAWPSQVQLTPCIFTSGCNPMVTSVIENEDNRVSVLTIGV